MFFLTIIIIINIIPRQTAYSDHPCRRGSPCWCRDRRGELGFQKTRPGSARSEDDEEEDDQGVDDDNEDEDGD